MSAGNFYKARAAVGFLIAALAACGGGGGGGDSGGSSLGSGGGTAQAQPAQPGQASVSISWYANHETGVNRAGGGYEVAISGEPTITLPYVSGSTAPTSTLVVLASGTYTVSVRAYAALDAQGGTTRTYSAPQMLTVSVP